MNLSCILVLDFIIKQTLMLILIAVSTSEEWAGSIHSLRTWIERALASPAARHSVLLWRLYMYLEV